MSPNVPDQCISVLRKIFGDELEQYAVTTEGSGIKGGGYVNEMLFLTLSKENSDIYLIVKMMPDLDESQKHLTTLLYDREIHFYETVWPALDTFQKDILSSKRFNKIPKFFGSLAENGTRLVVLENLKKSYFDVRDKEKFFDRHLVEFVFRHFGEFHALSMALKDKRPEEFNRLNNVRYNNSWNNFKDSTLVRGIIPDLTKLAISGCLEEADNDMKNKLIRFASRVLEEFVDITEYQGNYGVITHGDCWINNFMFKENKYGQFEDLRFIDFQFVQVATVVYDLSYFFYCGATKDLLEDLEHFLHVYHDSLSSRLREFGCDPDKLYPYVVLKEEWMQYAKFGFIMGLLLWAEKFSKPVDIFNDEEVAENKDNIDKEPYLRYTKDLIQHALKKNII